LRAREQPRADPPLLAVASARRRGVGHPESRGPRRHVRGLLVRVAPRPGHDVPLESLRALRAAPGVAPPAGPALYGAALQHARPVPSGPPSALRRLVL